MQKLSRVLLATQGMNGGGAERVMSVLCNGLAARGVEVCLCYTGKSRKPSVYALDGRVDVFYSKSAFSARTERLQKIFGRAADFDWLSRRRRLRRKVKEFRPQAVVAFIDYPAGMMLDACRGLGVPVVFAARNSLEDRIKKDSGIIEKYKSFYPGFAGAVFQTERQRRQYLETFDFSDDSEQAVIVNPAEPSALWDRPRNPLPHAAAAVGREDAQKNYPLLIKAFAGAVKKYPDWKLSVYGKLRENSRIPVLIDELGIGENVELRGFCPDVAERLFESSLFLMSSDYEGLPNALIEAMCLGLPCAVTDFGGGGARELITDGENGLIVPAGDCEALTGAIVRLMENPGEANRLGEEAKNLRKRVDAEGIIDEWVDFLIRVVDKRGAGA